MKKLDAILREILFQATENGQRRFVQKNLANLFQFSLSTVFHALQRPRDMGAVRIGGRFGEVIDTKKLLLYWATLRRLSKEKLYETSVPLSVLELEGQMTPEIVYGAFSAFRRKFKEVPADYDHVYVYSLDPQNLRKRFPFRKGPPNLTVLKADPFLIRYGQITPLAQTFADLWNLPQWYARDFCNALLERIP